MRRNAFLVILILFLLLTACQPRQAGGSPTIIATTSIVGDVVQQVAGDRAAITVLVPPDVDEHSFEPSPRDIARVSDASLVFMNGAGLEGFIEKLIENAGGSVKLVSVSEGITPIEGEDDHADEAEDDHADESGADPHFWTDPNNVLVWVDNIERELIQADPAGEQVYRANAEAYRVELRALDTWVSEQVAQIPPENRRLVTDHKMFTYFAERYGFEQIGAIVPGYSTLASPSAQELAALEDAIRAQNVPVIFVGSTVNPALAERVAADTNTRLVRILTGSLTEAGGEAPTYLEYIRYNVTAIVEALKSWP